MFTISNDGIIVINRGDTFSCPLVINSLVQDVTSRYVLTKNDILTFSIYYPETHYYSNGVNTVALRHIYSNDGGEGHISYTLNEYNDLPILFTKEEMSTLVAGNYYYEVKLQYTDADKLNRLDTIIEKKKMLVLE